MYHPRLKGNHYAMGQKMGTLFKKGNVRFPIRLDSFQTGFGRESGRLLKQFFPEASEEIRGITDITEYDNERFTSWMMCMGCCLYNLDEGISVETRGCTAFSFMHDGKVYYGRDNDLPPFFKQGSKSIYYDPENGYRFILNTSSFINGEEGINEYGLVASMTFVLPKMDEIIPGLNSVFLVRYILEKCKTVRESFIALGKLPVASSCNILLADKSGEMFVAECSPAEIHVRFAEKNEKNERFTIAVNNFTSGEMRKHDAGNQNSYFSEDRYQTAYKALKNMDYNDGVEHARNIASGKYGFMCQYGKELNFDTIWSSVFDITNNRVYRAEGNPLKTKFIEDKRLSVIKAG